MTTGIEGQGSAGNLLVRRLLVSLGAAAAYRLVLSVPTPGIDTHSGVLAEFFGSQAGPGAAYAVGAEAWAAMVPRGILSYLGASLLVLLASAVIPPLRRLREGGVVAGVTFDRLIVGLALVFAAAQGWGTALFLEGITGPMSGRPLVPDPGAAFRLLSVASAAGGMAVVVWLAHAITRWGLGNGVAVLLATELVAGLGTVVVGEWRAVAAGTVALRHGLYGTAALVLAAAAAVAATRATRRLPLVRAEGGGAAPGSKDGTAPPGGGPAIALRLNATGVLPIRGTMAIIPTLLAGRTLSLSFLGLPSLWLDFPPKGTAAVAGTIVAGGMLLLLLTHAYAFITLDPKDAVQRVGRLGFRLEGTSSEAEAASLVRRTQRGLATANAAYLLCVALAPWILDRAVGVGPAVAAYCGTHMLVLAAVALQVAAQARHELGLAVAGWKRGDGEEWVTAWSAQTELEVEIGRQLLDEAGVACTRRSNRVVVATGTPAYWEVARPRWPGLTIHRRLGGGGADLLVPAHEWGRARELLRAAGAELEGPGRTPGMRSV